MKYINRWLPRNILYLGNASYQRENNLFGIKQEDRLFHMFILGKTGTGKTTLLKNLALQDIDSHRGFAFLDPHGDVVTEIIRTMPPSKRENVIYLDVTNPNISLGYNPLKKVSIHQRPLVASGLLEIFRKLFGEQAWGVKMEHILRNILLTLLDQENTSLKDIMRILVDEKFQKECLKNITNDEVKSFWVNEYFKYTDGARQTATAPIKNKVGAFLSNPIAKQILVDFKEEISLRKIMDNKEILLINLSKGKIGEDASSLLGAILLHSLGLSAFSRANIAEEKRIPFYLYVDEFQNFSTLSTVNLLSELRKFKLGAVLANQYLSQLDPKIRDAIFGNVGTIISFRLGVNDATYMSKEFFSVFSFADIVNLPNYHVYLKLMIDGVPSQPFSAHTLKRV